MFTPIIYYIKATFKSKVMTDGYMQIDFPNKLIFSAGTNQIQVKKKIASGSESELSKVTVAKYETSNNYQFIKTIKIEDCCLSNCGAKEQIVLTVYGSVLTPYSSQTEASKTPVVVSSFEAIIAVIDSGNLEASAFRSNVLSELPKGEFTRSSTRPGDSSGYIDLTINIGDYPVEQNAIMRITIPSDQMQVKDEDTANVPVCNRYVNGAYEATNSVITVVSYDVTKGLVLDTNEFCSGSDSFCPANSVMKFRIKSIQNAYYVNGDKSSDTTVQIYKTGIDI